MATMQFSGSAQDTATDDFVLLGAVDELDPHEVIALSGVDFEAADSGAELLGARKKRSLKKLGARIKQRAKAIGKRLKTDKKFRRKVIGGAIASALIPGMRGRLARIAAMKKLAAKRKAAKAATIARAAQTAPARAMATLRARVQERAAAVQAAAPGEDREGDRPMPGAMAPAVERSIYPPAEGPTTDTEERAMTESTRPEPEEGGDQSEAPDQGDQGEAADQGAEGPAGIVPAGNKMKKLLPILVVGGIVLFLATRKRGA